MPLLKNFPCPADMILHCSLLCYEINEDNDTFQLAVNIPGVKAGDLNISVERDGHMLCISGQCKVKEENIDLNHDLRSHSGLIATLMLVKFQPTLLMV